MAKILVVDDARFNVELLALALTDENHEVNTAYDGQGALDAVAADKPDLILLDVIMPEINGLEVCRTLKADEHTRDIPIMLISARDENDDMIIGLDHGADDYISKPFYMPVVLARVRSMLRIKEAIDTEAQLRGELEEKVGELERLYQELRESQQELLHLKKTESIGKFAAGMAHEFNNMLCGIGGIAELLQYDIEDENARKQLQTINKVVTKGATFIAKLQSYAKEMNYAKAAFSPSEIMQAHADAVKSFIEAQGDKNITYDYQVIDPQYQINADADYFLQILMILVTNACDAIDNEGNIQIKSEVSEQNGKAYLKLSVIDNGRGIEDTEIDKIFDPFYTTKDVDEGAGLGLSKVWGYVYTFDGHIEVDSSFGQGTSMTIYLPLLVANG